jgi:hypothetical protein
MGPPTRLPQDNQRLGSPTLLRPPFAPRQRLVRIRPKTASEQPTLGVGADTVVQEYQPVVHRLRLSASP